MKEVIKSVAVISMIIGIFAALWTTTRLHGIAMMLVGLCIFEIYRE